MIPGCKVFFQGALCGIMIIPVMFSAVRSDWSGLAVTGIVCFISFWCGMSNAFRLLRMEPRP